jgi:hypothetical protein
MAMSGVYGRQFLASSQTENARDLRVRYWTINDAEAHNMVFEKGPKKPGLNGDLFDCTFQIPQISHRYTKSVGQ